MILYFIGLTESYEGEGYDRKNLKIPQNQEELLAEIAETVGKDHIAAISFGGAPMDFSFETHNIVLCEKSGYILESLSG